MQDPKTHRHVHTRDDGVLDIPREQKGVPFKEYFKNVELPPDLDRGVVYVTEKGPVLLKPDPVPWSMKHDDMAADFANRLKDQIDRRGYYSKVLAAQAERLADATGLSREETKALIVKSFAAQHGKEPFAYLEAHREAQGLPTRGPDHGPSREPEM